MPQSPSPNENKHVSSRNETLEVGSVELQPGSEEVVPLLEEHLRVEAREAVTGKVRIRTLTDTVEEIARADLKREAVEVTRVPINRVVETAPEVRTENDVTIVPVIEEILVIEKRLILKEELHIRRRVENEAVEIPVQLRKQRALVERVNSDDIQNSPEETSE